MDQLHSVVTHWPSKARTSRWLSRGSWRWALVSVLVVGGCGRSRAGDTPGCGAALEPLSERWVSRSDEALRAKIERAMQCGRARGTKVLLEFTAPWCADCQAMARIEDEEPAATVLAQRFERVRVNIGQWDEHRAWVERFGVRAIAAYVVLDPTSGAVVAQTTREPITSTDGALTSEQWAAWLSAVR
jgi:thiol:disulfide interchange protein